MKNEVAIVAVIITRHLFTDIQKTLWREGSLEIYERISKCAEEFVMTYAHVENWDEYLKDEKADDWEVFILSFANKHPLFNK